jgi:hypothetical protein
MGISSGRADRFGHWIQSLPATGLTLKNHPFDHKQESNPSKALFCPSSDEPNGA